MLEMEDLSEGSGSAAAAGTGVWVGVGRAGLTVTAEWALSVLELVMELNRLPASFLVMVAGAWMASMGKTLGHKAEESGLGEHSRAVGRETG
jgi:hypothetical protein